MTETRVFTEAERIAAAQAYIDALVEPRRGCGPVRAGLHPDRGGTQDRFLGQITCAAA